jgi:hypothetical protein
MDRLARSWRGARAVALAGNAGAGIAAIGGAICIPLWVVLGRGGVTLGVIVDKLVAARQKSKDFEDVDG